MKFKTDKQNKNTKDGFTIIPKEEIANKDISSEEFRVLYYLISKHNIKDWKYNFSDIINNTGLAEYSVSKAVNGLEDKGYIERIKHNDTIKGWYYDWKILKGFAKEKFFAIIKNSVICDNNISSDSFRILCYCEQNSKDTAILINTKDIIMKELNMGEYIIRKSIKELKDYGYISVVPVKENGKIRKYSWLSTQEPDINLMEGYIMKNKIKEFKIEEIWEK